MRKRKAEERRNTLKALSVLAVLVIAFLAFASRPGLLVPVTNASYGSSLGSAVSGGGGSCSSSPRDDWLVCAVETDQGSGPGATMLLRKDARGCWTARWMRGKKEPLSGCVGILDLLHPTESSATY